MLKVSSVLVKKWSFFNVDNTALFYENVHMSRSYLHNDHSNIKSYHNYNNITVRYRCHIIKIYLFNWIVDVTMLFVNILASWLSDWIKMIKIIILFGCYCKVDCVRGEVFMYHFHKMCFIKAKNGNFHLTFDESSQFSWRVQLFGVFQKENQQSLLDISDFWPLFKPLKMLYKTNWGNNALQEVWCFKLKFK